VWDIAELVQAALEEPVGDAPVKKPLGLNRDAGTARQTSTGAWLRAVPGGAANVVAPEPKPVEPPPAPVATAAVAREAPVEDMKQIDLFSWKPRKGEQLRLF
jgi:hypothetical protein